MKAISELNNKWWYRLIKVIFVCLVLFSVFISIIAIKNENRSRQVKDYKIDCIGNDANKKSFFAEKDLGIYILYLRGTNNVYNSLNADDRKKIREACDISEEEASAGIQKITIYINEQEKLGVDTTTIQKYIYDNFRPYTISETRRTEGGYIKIIGYSLLSLLIILIVAEIIRRIFYYIVLGKIRPEKWKPQ